MYLLVAIAVADGATDPSTVDTTARAQLPADGLGAFVRCHRGQDFYNIAFKDRLDVVQWGVTFNLDRPDRYAP